MNLVSKMSLLITVSAMIAICQAMLCMHIGPLQEGAQKMSMGNMAGAIHVGRPGPFVNECRWKKVLECIDK